MKRCRTRNDKLWLFSVACLIISLCCISSEVLAQGDSGLKFEIAFPEEAHDSAVKGRVYVMISREDDREPRLQISVLGTPFWGKDVESLNPGESEVIDENDFGYPLVSIKDIPPGEYFVQGFVNIYSEFKRSDGHTLWMHDDQWEGQQWNRSPGNLYSDVSKITIDPAEDTTIKLTVVTSFRQSKFPKTRSGSNESNFKVIS